MSDNTTDTPRDIATQAREAHQAIAAIHEKAQQQISQVTMEHQRKKTGEDNEG